MTKHGGYRHQVCAQQHFTSLTIYPLSSKAEKGQILHPSQPFLSTYSVFDLLTFVYKSYS